MNERKDSDMMKLRRDALLMRVQRPARYTGGEINAVCKDAAEVDLRFVFAFPDTYEIGMSCLGMQIIYSLLNDMKGVFCERVFAPSADMQEEMIKAGIPLFSLESKEPVSDADIVGFSLQYEMSFTNVLNMLKLSGIPIRKGERTADHPLLIAGGPCSFNPEPLSEVFDMVLVGDGEDSLMRLAELYISMRGQGKRAFLESAAGIQGVYVPEFYDHEYHADGRLKGINKLFEGAPFPVQKAIVRDLDSAAFPEGNLVPLIEIIHDRASIELFRGCTRGCRFCQAGMIYRPVRERTPDNVIKIAKKQIENTGYEEISLLSLSTSDYSRIEPLVSELMTLCKSCDVALSVPSLRLDSFSFKMLEDIQGYKKSGLTFAPEAGTQRLRDVINKSLTEDDIFSAVRQAIELGWTHIKLYFMVGLPTETEEDLDGIVKLVADIMDIYYQSRGGRKGGRFDITVSVSNFVPKPHTPFQWFAQNGSEQLFEKNMYLKDRFWGMKHVKFQYHDNKTSFLEGVFARGDRRLFDVLMNAHELGCRFDSWNEHFKFDMWLKAFETAGIDPEFYSGRQRDYDEVFPWDGISCGVSKEFLIGENEAALQQRTLADCRSGCHGCGADRFFSCDRATGEGKVL